MRSVNIARSLSEAVISPSNDFIKVWRGGRAAECTGLENQQGIISLRGFKSHPLRHYE
jgi:hypothetical protein